MRPERIYVLNNNDLNKSGTYVLYMMQASQRISYNHALCYAIKLANNYNKPLVIGFALIPKYPNANTRHYYFMLEGILELKKYLENKGINFVMQLGDYKDVCLELSENSLLTITDFGYLRYQLLIRNEVAKEINTKFIAVESDIVVPIKEASNKAESFARTIRPKILQKLNEYLYDFEEENVNNKTKISFDSQLKLDSENDIENLLKLLEIDYLKDCREFFRGGYSKALNLLNDFTLNKLKYYGNFRNVPSKNYSTNLSPYLHFGQISSLEILNYAEKKNKEAYEKNKYSLLNELVIWRELARNFTYYENKIYDSHECIPEWAKKEFEKHEKDKREYIYDLKTLEKAETHDKLWNAAQKELVITGKIHNYVRMYWGKKVLEWTENYKQAFNYLIYLNDKYALDGRDPNTYLSISWIFGKFDRPFYQDRPIIGKIRPMTYNGIKNKHPDIDKYISKIEMLECLL
ncbi:MAG: deoxyribodipyrimidine photo-lyase [Candidatus Anstonellales archaeon]